MKHERRRTGRVTLALTLAIMLVLGLSGSAAATEGRHNGVVVVAAGEVIDDDMILSGERIEVNGTVRGDLFALGSEVEVNGTVVGSLVAVGYALAVNGQVDGSVYAAGGELVLGSGAQIGGNLYFGGFSLRAEEGSTVRRGLYAGDYQTVLNGEVRRDVAVNTGVLELNGIVGGDVLGEVADAERSSELSATCYQMCHGADLPEEPTVLPLGLRVSDDADVGGAVNVELQPWEMPPFEDAGLPTVRHVTLGLARAVLDRIGEFVALLIVGGLFLRFWPDLSQRTSATIRERPIPSAGRGCLLFVAYVVAVPLAVILLIVLAIIAGLVTFGKLFGTIATLGGALLFLAIAVFGFVLSLVTKTAVALAVGQLLLPRLAPDIANRPNARVWALVVGAVLYEIVRAIPILGWLASAIVALVGLGAIYLAVRGHIRAPSLEAAKTA